MLMISHLCGMCTNNLLNNNIIIIIAVPSIHKGYTLPYLGPASRLSSTSHSSIVILQCHTFIKGIIAKSGLAGRQS